uniref:basic proline-rich protein-like n=1 Tax=Jaculus jaculus TaxID=51337 RepID=UPI001E1B0B9C|nr:basic proline-rich protein-like [Jaculus jaculus]
MHPPPKRSRGAGTPPSPSIPWAAAAALHPRRSSPRPPRPGEVPEGGGFPVRLGRELGPGIPRPKTPPKKSPQRASFPRRTAPRPGAGGGGGRPHPGAHLPPGAGQPAGRSRCPIPSTRGVFRLPPEAARARDRKFGRFPRTLCGRCPGAEGRSRGRREGSAPPTRGSAAAQELRPPSRPPPLGLPGPPAGQRPRSVTSPPSFLRRGPRAASRGPSRGPRDPARKQGRRCGAGRAHRGPAVPPRARQGYGPAHWRAEGPRAA